MQRWAHLVVLLALAGDPGCARGKPAPNTVESARGALTGAPAAAKALDPYGGASIADGRGPEASATGVPEGASAGAATEEAPPAEEEIDDGFEGAPVDTPAPAPPPQSPLLKLSDKEFEERMKRDPASLGSMSVGAPNAGALVNGVPMPKGERWVLISPAGAWGTQETIDYLVRCIDKVNEQLPGAPKAYIGHISDKDGGHLLPHKSHQSGRDVDIGYYLTPPHVGFIRTTADNIDLARTWAFVRALITETDVEMLLIDTSVQRLLSDYAAKQGEDEAWLDDIFQVRAKGSRPLIRHARGHDNHLHIRFFNPVAQEVGRRAHRLLPQRRLPAMNKVTTTYFNHKARSGDTLVILARRYGTTPQAIQQANGLRGIALKAGRVYKIPKKGVTKLQPQPQTPPKAPPPLVLPARRLPPPKPAAPPSAPSSPK
jgi:LysM repeat protein/murein endopeptidase